MKPASPIHLLERDFFLNFGARVPVWPPADLDLLKRQDQEEEAEEAKEETWLASAWRREELDSQAGGFLCRELKRTRGKTDPPQRGEVSLREAILRFPSAPLFGIQSQLDYQVRMEPVHQHTLRLLTSSRSGERPAIKKLFLLFNGVNEIDYFDFYYELASLLIGNAEENSEVACLIPPFPAHLTRYPLFGKYAEKPLQRFITDPSDLFRQYLRFIVEMQWLLSALVPVSYYPVTPGIPLLAEDMEPSGGRSKTEILSNIIYRDWKAIFKSQRRGKEILEADVCQAITVLRKLIGWKASTSKLVDRNPKLPLDPPQIHVIGYSLGGYLAQSVFFTWPFAIGSCTTLCSGGALNSLRPEKFIHEEEWRAITHGLKYELESGMLEGRLKADKPAAPQSVCGIPVSFFTSHFQTFNDIFLQDPHGSYRHRVSEFAPRLFFVVGGNDPIVSTQSVLDTSPPGGINMIEIAKLSHFIARERGEWPSFWLPTIAGIISSFSAHSEQLLRDSMLVHLWNEETTDGALNTWLISEKEIKQRQASGTLQRRTKADLRESEPLDSDRIQTAILQVVDILQTNGFLLTLRNQIPDTLMGQQVLHRRGTVPHYADFEIRRFWERLQEQRLTMLQHAPRITLVIPGRLNEWFVRRPSTLSFKHLPVVRELPDRERQQRIWDDFLGDWEETAALYRFDPEHPAEISSPVFKLERMIREDTGTPSNRWVLNCLPDTWISLSKDVITSLAGGIVSREDIREDIHAKLADRMCMIYSGKRRKKRGERMKDAEREASEDLVNWVESGGLRIIRISAAQSSPRFLGERIWNPDVVVDLLTHSALALARSSARKGKGSFKEGWPPERAARIFRR